MSSIPTSSDESHHQVRFDTSMQVSSDPPLPPRRVSSSPPQARRLSPRRSPPRSARNPSPLIASDLEKDASGDDDDDDTIFLTSNVGDLDLGRGYHGRKKAPSDPSNWNLGVKSGVFSGSDEKLDLTSSSIQYEGMTKDQVMRILLDFSKTLTAESATKIDRTYQAKISGSDIGDKKPIELNGSKVSIEAAGRLIHESATNLLKSCGKELLLTVLYNLDIDDWINQISSQMQSVQTSYEELEVRSTRAAGNHYSEDFFKAEADLKFEEQRYLLLAMHIQHWKDYCEYANQHMRNQAEQGIANPVRPSKPFREWKLQDIVEERSTSKIDFSSPDLYANVRKYVKENLAIFKRQALVEYDEYLQEKKSLKEFITLRAKRHYINNVKEHNERIKQINKDKIVFAKLKSKRSETDALKQLNIALSTATSLIAEKLRNAAKTYPELVTKLHGTVKLERTQEVVYDTYNTCSLAGMLEILRVEYACANIVTLKHKLLEVMNLSLTRDQMEGDPAIGIQSIQRHINTWQSLQLFQYLNEDIFWTVHFLRQYHTNTQIYQRGIERTMEYMHRIQSGEAVAKSSNLVQPGMPILSDLFEWLRKVYGQSIQFSQAKNQKRISFGNNNDGRNNQQQQQQQQTRSNRPYPNNESQWANIAQESNFATKQMNPPAKSYDREVKREESIGIRNAENNTRWHSYTATRAACTKCVGSDKTHPRPYCYLGQCNKCKFFGHQERYCLQSGKNPLHA